jgi:small nuclear ribonucleoprotein (snRNP)-like protein
MALQTKTISANGSKGHHKFTLTVNELSTSVVDNQSTLSWQFTISPIKTGYDWSFSSTTAMSYSVTVNGATYSGTLNKYDGSSTIILATNNEHKVSHNADGSKEISFSFSVESANYSYLPGSASNSGTMSLTNIPRKATITSAPDFNDEQNPTITYSNLAGNAVDSLAVCISLDGSIDDIAYRSISKTGNSYTFSLTDAERKILRKAITSGTSRTIDFYIRTIIGGVSYYHSIRKTLTLINYHPTFNPKVVDINTTTTSLTGDSSKIVRYYSVVSVTSGAAAVKEATIASQKITCGNYVLNAGSGTFNNLNSSIFNFSATDSRGNAAGEVLMLQMVNYIKLTSNFRVSKPNLNGEITLTFNGNYFGGSFGAVNNTLDLKYRYKINNGSYGNWITVNPTFDYTSYNTELKLTIANFDYKNRYTFQAIAEDKLIELESDEYTVSALPVFDWGENDFNFNVPFAVHNVEQDYIVEEGTTGIWTWRKWNSGKAECWGTYTLKTAVNTAWGSLYVGNSKMSRINYPIVFANKPTETVQVQSGANAVWVISESGGNGVNGAYASAIYNVCRPTAVASSGDYYLSFQVIGKWK